MDDSIPSFVPRKVWRTPVYSDKRDILHTVYIAPSRKFLADSSNSTDNNNNSINCVYARIFRKPNSSSSTSTPKRNSGLLVQVITTTQIPNQTDEDNLSKKIEIADDEIYLPSNIFHALELSEGGDNVGLESLKGSENSDDKESSSENSGIPSLIPYALEMQVSLLAGGNCNNLFQEEADNSIIDNKDKYMPILHKALEIYFATPNNPNNSSDSNSANIRSSPFSSPTARNKKNNSTAKKTQNIPRLVTEGETITVPLVNVLQELGGEEDVKNSNSSRKYYSKCLNKDLEASGHKYSDLWKNYGCNFNSSTNSSNVSSTNVLNIPNVSFKITGLKSKENPDNKKANSIAEDIAEIKTGGKSNSNSLKNDSPGSPKSMLVSLPDTRIVLDPGFSRERKVPFGSNAFLNTGSPQLPYSSKLIVESERKLASFFLSRFKNSNTNSNSNTSNTSISNSTAVALFHGPRSSGKRTIANFACDRIGAHYFEVNLALEKSPFEEIFAEKIRDFARARPAVINFRNFNTAVQPANLSGQNANPRELNLLHQRIKAVVEHGLSDKNLKLVDDGTSVVEKNAEDAGKSGSSTTNSDSENINNFSQVIVVFSLENPDDFSPVIKEVSDFELGLKLPNEADRKRILFNFSKEKIKTIFPEFENSLVSKTSISCFKKISSALAMKTPNFNLLDLENLAESAAHSICEKLKISDDSNDASKILEDETFAEKNILKPYTSSKIKPKPNAKTGNEVKLKRTDICWDDIGGMEKPKSEIMDCIELPLKKPHLFKGKKLRAGILLFGPPGTGKTLLARAVAAECEVTFISVKGPELLSMYIGESEKNVRDVFNHARECTPCVIFFDELDSIAPAKGVGSDSGGVMDRVVSQLLTEMDDLPCNVFVLGATNRPDLLDSSLMRPGRLDRAIYLGISPDKSPVLKAATRKFDLEKDVDIPRICSTLPPNFTGADTASLASDAFMLALSERTELLQKYADGLEVSVPSLLIFVEEESKKTSNIEDGLKVSGAGNSTITYDKDSGTLKKSEKSVVIESDLHRENIGNLLIVQVGNRHFEAALKTAKPSVPMSDLARYEKLAEQYRNDTV